MFVNYSFVLLLESFDFIILSEKDKRGLERGDWFCNDGFVYVMMVVFRLGILGLVLFVSFFVLLVWIGEKYFDWIDFFFFI